MKLRDYQQEAIDSLWKCLFTESVALCVLPTGCGKTECFIGLLAKALKAKKDLKALVLLNRVKLLEQTTMRLERALPFGSVGSFCGTLKLYDSSSPITVASIDSIAAQDLDNINLIILDECHNLSEDEHSRYMSFIKANQKKNERLKVIGFTATPYRATGLIYGKGKFFPSITYTKPISFFFRNGWLTKPVMKNIRSQSFETKGLSMKMGDYDSKQVSKLTGDKEKVFNQVRDALTRSLDRNKIVWCCASIDHSEMVKEALVSLGEKAETIHSKQKPIEQLQAKKNFEQGSSRHLSFVSIVSEGYDNPAIDCVVLMRPTRSPTRYVQTVGRGLRLHERKEDCLILDYARVVENCGPLDSPIIPRKGERNKSEINMKFCPQCLSYVKINEKECPDCGHEFVKARVNRLKNIESMPDHDSRIVQGSSSYKAKISQVRTEKHQSKSGNLCLRLDYYSVTDILSGLMVISEYFVMDKAFAIKKAKARLHVMGEKLTTLDALSGKTVKNPPQSIEYVIKDGFKRIEKLNFRDADSNRDPRLSEQKGRHLCVEIE